MTTAIRKDVGQEQGHRPHVDFLDAVGHINTAPRTRQKASSVYREHYESRPDPALVAAQAHIDATPWSDQEPHTVGAIYRNVASHRPWFDPNDDGLIALGYTTEATTAHHWPTHAGRVWFILSAVASAFVVIGIISWVFS